MSTKPDAQPTTLFIGLGNMGKPMVTRYAQAFSTCIYDLNSEVTEKVAEESGSTALSNLNDLPDGIETVILMLPNSRIVEGTLIGESGFLPKLDPGTLVIDMSSSEPSSTRKLAAEASERKLHYVDAPVSGGVAKAESGELSIIVGGSDEAIEAALPHLEKMGSRIVKAGPAGAGHAAKALNNLLSATNLAAAAEILCVAKANGINPDVMVDIINSATSRSQSSEVKYPRHILTGTFDSGFAMDLMIKDMAIAMTLIQDNDIAAPIISRANDVAAAAREALDSEHPDHTELARYVEEINHTYLRSAK